MRHGVLFVLALAVACKSTPADSDPTPGDSDSPEGPTLAEIPIPAEADSTCAAACTALSGTCTDTCEFGSGVGHYGISPFESARADEPLACDTSIPETVTADGETISLRQAECCCSLPEVTVEAGNAADRMRCERVCTDAGWTGCTDAYAWHEQGGALAGEQDIGGLYMTWESPAGSTTTEIGSCDERPPAENDIAGGLKALASFQCACVE